jgi:hypothetical protein
MIHCDTASIDDGDEYRRYHEGAGAMNNRSVLRAMAIAVLVIAGAAVIGVAAYNAGFSQGIVEAGRTVTAPSAGTPYVYVWPRPWGFGFFPIFPFFLVLLFFFVLRGLLWRGPWRGGRYGDVPPAFEEWHRRAHAEPQPSRPTSGSTT